MHQPHDSNAPDLKLSRRRFLGRGLAGGLLATLAGCKKDETPEVSESTPAVPPLAPPGAGGPAVSSAASAAPSAPRVALSSDGAVMAACQGGKVHVWTIAGRGKLSMPEAERLPAVGAVALSPDGQILACGSGKSIVLLALIGGRVIQTLAGHDADVHALAFTPDGRMLASGGADCLIRLWSLPEGKEVKKVANVFSTVNALAVTPDGKWLLSGSGSADKGDLALWSLPAGEPVTNLAGHEHSVGCLAVSPDGTHLASSGGGKVRLWTLPTAKPVSASLDNGTSDRDMAFLRSGKVLGCVADQGVVRMWLVPKGNDLGTLPNFRKPVVGLAALPGKGDGVVALDAVGAVWLGNAVNGGWRELSPSGQGNA
jgi:WD40 repeat protein